MKKYDRSWPTWFNKNKSKELYEEVLTDILPEHKKCQCCNGPIYYYDSTFRISKGNLRPEFKSYISTKEVLGKTFNLSVCEDCLTLKYPEYQTLNKSRVFNRICDITNYAFNIPEDLAKDWKQKNYSITEENLIIKHGDEKGKKKWKDYCDKQSLTNTFEYKKEKYGWSEEKFKEYNNSRAVTFENCIIKHGEEKGLEIWQTYIERQRYTCSLEYFIEEYGYIDGTKKFQNFITKRTDCLIQGFSNISQEVFENLKHKLNSKYTIFYAIENNEWCVKNNNICYYLDFYIKELNIAVEFNGDVWHANPKIFKADDIPIKIGKNKKAKDIWKYDEDRLCFLKTKIDKIFIIWENDLKKNGIDKTVEDIHFKINEFIKQKDNNEI